jgi:cation:H+ antiporter
MSLPVAIAAFLAGALISLATSWLLVSRLERVGERLGLSEALLGLVAALAADAPEVTAAVSAMAGHQQQIGAGVVIGSNVFNLAALLGLGAVAAGRIRLHRKVVLLGGAVAIWVASACMLVVTSLLSSLAGLVLAAGGVALYAVVLGVGRRRLPLPAAWTTWLQSAIAEEEQELEDAIRPQRASRQDFAMAAGALLVVVAASVLMERAASALGSRFAVPELITGGLVLAAVTSLPNAVAAVYLASRGRGAATLSTALNSNALNVTIGLLIPATFIELGRPSGQSAGIAAWYAGLTVMVLAFAYLERGISRATGVLIIAAYLVFAGSLLASAYAPWPQPGTTIEAGVATAAVFGARLLVLCRRDSRYAKARPAGRTASGDGRPEPLIVSANGSGSAAPHARPPACEPEKRQQSLLPGRPVRPLWQAGLALTLIAAAADAGLGHRVILIGLLITGPCCVLLTGRWMPTGIIGLLAVGLAVVLGLPDGIWGTSTHLAFLAAVTGVALACTLAAAVIQARGPSRP